jgi:Type II CAAX prenyl endopeptidase Rce1-like
MGLRRPADVKESIVLAFSAWLIFVLLAGVWALMSQSAAEREANNPLIRERTENSQGALAPVSPNGSDARSSATPSADGGTTNIDETNTESNSNETTTTRTDQSRDTEKGDVADNRHVLIKVLNDDPPKALLISILIAGCIGAPLLEELLVRGLLFGAFSQRFGRLVGGAVSSLLFGFAHIMAYPIKMIPPLVVMGVVLAWLAWQTGSIVPGIFIHAFVNSIGLGMAASLGAHTFTLMVGSWLVLAILLLPWLRSKSLAGLASS